METNNNKPIQGIYNSVPWTSVNLPDMDENIEMIKAIINAMPKSLISLTYAAQDDKAVLNLIFFAPKQDIDANKITNDIYNQVFDLCGIESYSVRALGYHTFYTCESPL